MNIALFVTESSLFKGFVEEDKRGIEIIHSLQKRVYCTNCGDCLWHLILQNCCCYTRLDSVMNKLRYQIIRFWRWNCQIDFLKESKMAGWGDRQDSRG
jgi:hypothetical protein